MKLTTTALSMKRKSRMTLLELTAVILVLLSLISILFIGARAWQKGSGRSASILTIRNVQQAARSFANMNGLPEGGAVATTDLFGTGKLMQNNPTSTAHPGGAGLSYTIAAPTVIPAVGMLYLTVTGTAAADSAPALITCQQRARIPTGEPSRIGSDLNGSLVTAGGPFY